MAAITVTVDQDFPSAVVHVTDDRGNAVTPDTPPTWASSDETVLKVTPAADGMTAVVDTVAPGGPARISVSDILASGTALPPAVSDDVTVTAGAAAVLTVDLGAPTAKAPPGP